MAGQRWISSAQVSDLLTGSLSRSIFVVMDDHVERLAELVAAGVKARVSHLLNVFFVVLLLLDLLEGVFSSLFLLQ